MTRSTVLPLAIAFVCSAAACGPSSSTNELHRGWVSIMQADLTVAGMMFTTANHSASFTDIPANSDAGVTVSERTEGPCTVTRVVAPPSDGDAGMRSNVDFSVSAGSITIAGGSGPAITLEPDAMNHYSDNTQQMARWNGGDVITVSAAGGRVPPFQTMVTFPSRITVTSPMMPAVNTRLTIMRTGFTTQWMSTGAGTVRVLISQGNSNGGTLIDCSYPFGDGMGTVPAAALSNLTPGEDAVVIVSSAARSTVNAGEFRVDVAAMSLGLFAQATIQ